MGCFDNIIGIGGCEEATPTSGHYLRDAGISLSDLGRFFGDDYSDGIELANDKIRVATNLVVNELSANFASKYLIRTFLDDGRIGYFSENKTTKAGANEWRGVDLVLWNNGSYVDMYIDKIQMHVAYTGNVALKVYDVIQNVVLDSFTVPVVSGTISDYTINKTYSSEKKKLHLFIGYNATGIDSYETSITSSGCSSCNIGAYYNVNSNVSAKSVYITGSTITDENIKGLSHTSGLSLLYSLKCNHTNWLCRYKNELAPAIAFKASAEIIQYALYQSERSNMKVSDIKALKERWNLYNSNYVNYLKNLVQNMVLPNDNKCFQCKDLTRSRITLP